MNVTSARPLDEMVKPIYVMTTNPDGIITMKKLIDFDNHSDRVWLSKHCCWCMHNGHGVATWPHAQFKG